MKPSGFSRPIPNASGRPDLIFVRAGSGRPPIQRWCQRVAPAKVLGRAPKA